MAEIIPPLNKRTLGRMTTGEKRLAHLLQTRLEDDCLVWYDIPVGRQRRYPDFIVLHPGRGLLFLEVKDYKPDTLVRVSKTDVTLETANGRVTKPHPLEQARQYTYQVVNKLARDPRLCQAAGAHQGNLIMPWGWGVVFTRITRKHVEKAMPENEREVLLPDHLLMYQDEITQNAEAETFQKQLWDMFHYRFGKPLNPPQIDRIRWHLFPEIRIDGAGQTALFGGAADPPAAVSALPDIVKVMDTQQERLARSLGQGHRVIHGVAGSGKTLILGYRCQYLSQTMSRPILVLCFNITLAVRLRAFISARGIGSVVQVCHFHGWCGLQLKTHGVAVAESDQPYWKSQVEAVINAVDKGDIPKVQYGALMIDEGHDFAADWLRLVTQMVDPETGSLLLLYDDAQSIYTGRLSGLGFNLSSVGIRAKGRTTILRRNYRNTRQILKFAHTFASHYLSAQDADDDHIPRLIPEAVGRNGPVPAVHQFNHLNQETNHALVCLRKWHGQGIPWADMAVLYFTGYQGRKIAEALRGAAIPNIWLGARYSKKAYDAARNQVAIMTLHSSKGLEFPRVVIMGIGQLKDNNDEQERNTRLLYVGITRAQQCLVLTTSTENEYIKRLRAATKILGQSH